MNQAPEQITVKELIEKLQTFPETASVVIYWDSDIRAGAGSILFRKDKNQVVLLGEECRGFGDE